MKHLALCFALFLSVHATLSLPLFNHFRFPRSYFFVGQCLRLLFGLIVWNTTRERKARPPRKLINCGVDDLIELGILASGDFQVTHIRSVPNAAARLQVRVHFFLGFGLDDLHPLCWRLLIFHCRCWPDEGMHRIILSYHFEQTIHSDTKKFMWNMVWWMRRFSFRDS